MNYSDIESEFLTELWGIPEYDLDTVSVYDLARAYAERYDDDNLFEYLIQSVREAA